MLVENEHIISAKKLDERSRTDLRSSQKNIASNFSENEMALNNSRGSILKGQSIFISQDNNNYDLLLSQIHQTVRDEGISKNESEVRIY